MARDQDWWASDLATSRGETPQERKLSADITQSGASAASSVASAESARATAAEKRATLPSTVT